PVIVKIMIEESRHRLKNRSWIQDQVFVMDLEVIVCEFRTPNPPTLHHPLPVESSGHQAPGLGPVPWQRGNSSHFSEREGDIASVANNVKEQGVWNTGF